MSILLSQGVPPVIWRKNMEEIKAPEKKKRIPLWLYPTTIEQVKQLYRGEQCKSYSEFIERAVRYYCGFLITNERNPHLPDAVTAVIEGNLGCFEDHISRLLFKLAVEQDIMSHIIACDTDIDDDQLNQLRSQCVGEVKRSNGQLGFKDALHYQKSL